MLKTDAVSYEVHGARLLDGVSISVRPGRLQVIIGPNGAGKSTLLRVLGGELRPTAGTVTLDGIELRKFHARELARRRAVVPQATTLSFPFTALEVVQLGASVPGFELPDRKIAVAAEHALATVGMADFAARLYIELSGGERQRVHIARAFCQLACAAQQPGETSVLLLDEPTSSLDLAHQSLVLNEMRRQAQGGRAVLAILHDLNLAAAFADEVVVMSRGGVAACGPSPVVFTDALLSEVFEHPVRVNKLPANGIPFVLPQTEPAAASSGKNTHTSFFEVF
jgi:iron complex transport system ATP-binding protein